MSSYTIERVEPETREWQTKDGKSFVSYRVEFTGDAVGEAEISKMPASPAPFPGEVLSDYELINGDPRFPAKLKRMKGSGAPGGSSGGGKSYGKSPQELAEMRRMSSQKQAIALLAVEVQAGLRFDNTKASDLLKPRIDFFDKDSAEAGGRA